MRGGTLADHVGIVTAVNPGGTVDLVNGDFLGGTNIGVEHDTGISLTSWASHIWRPGEQWVLVKPPAGHQAAAPAVTVTGPAKAVAGTSVSFRASASGPITKYRWTFGDGRATNVSGAAVSHVYAENGVYPVTVRAMSSGGTVTTRGSGGRGQRRVLGRGIGTRQRRVVPPRAGRPVRVPARWARPGRRQLGRSELAAGGDPRPAGPGRPPHRAQLPRPGGRLRDDAACLLRRRRDAHRDLPGAHRVDDATAGRTARSRQRDRGGRARIRPGGVLLRCRRPARLALAAQDQRGWQVSELPGSPAGSTALAATSYLLGRPSTAAGPARLGAAVYYLTRSEQPAVTYAASGQPWRTTALPGTAARILGADAYQTAGQPSRVFLSGRPGSGQLRVDEAPGPGGPWARLSPSLASSRRPPAALWLAAFGLAALGLTALGLTALWRARRRRRRPQASGP